jgi:hypothetical protein
MFWGILLLQKEEQSIYLAGKFIERIEAEKSRGKNDQKKSQPREEVAFLPQWLF